MKRNLIVILLVLAALLWVQTFRLRSSNADRTRLAQNQTALMSDMVRYRNAAGDSTVSAQVLRLKCAEFEQLRAADAEYIRDMGIKLKRIESAAKTATATIVELRAALRDTVVVRAPDNPSGPIVSDTLRTFRWRDPWVSVSGLIDRDSVSCHVESIDTLRQIIHRVPKRFLFFRWGTKAIRQEITSANPHTKIVYAEFVKLEK